MTLLSLGDSYTIGEQVAEHENFPNQLVKVLERRGINFSAPRIIAKTGWTTDELSDAIATQNIHEKFDYVTLLIGVNNQYRGRDVEEYAREFDSLLQQAISFAGKASHHVIVISIPDWSVTPFAALPRDNGDMNDLNKIAREIDSYNETNRSISEQQGVHYLYITDGTREAINDSSLLAADGLHPSAKEYQRWANRLADIIQKAGS